MEKFKNIICCKEERTKEITNDKIIQDNHKNNYDIEDILEKL